MLLLQALGITPPQNIRLIPQPAIVKNNNENIPTITVFVCCRECLILENPLNQFYVGSSWPNVFDPFLAFLPVPTIFQVHTCDAGVAEVPSGPVLHIDSTERSAYKGWVVVTIASIGSNPEEVLSFFEAERAITWAVREGPRGCSSLPW